MDHYQQDHVPWQIQDAQSQFQDSYPVLSLSSLSVTSSSPAPPPPPPPPPTTIPPTMNPQPASYIHPFAFAPAQSDQQPNGVANWHAYDHQPPFDIQRRTPGSSRSRASSEKSLSSKRSLSSITPLAVSVEEPTGVYDQQPSSAVDLRTPSVSAFDDEYVYGVDADASPVDGSDGSGNDLQDDLKPMDGLIGNGAFGFSVIGKPPSANNFVTKLYQMISDPKSAHFISWTDLGTSFVVSSVGEFSRSILGAHFKHNNFSSFVRQLNMYGFHKINRTPRAQRTSSDAQTWEFSHHKFLRGRPDLLDEIKRKALEPDPTLRQRVELPAEVSQQLSKMNDEHRHVVKELQLERGKVERLSKVVKAMYDFICASFPGQITIPFPSDILDGPPRLYVASHGDRSQAANATPSQPHFSLPPQLYTRQQMVQHHPLSPSSSPTSPDFPPHYLSGPPQTTSPPPVNGHASAAASNGRRTLPHRISFDHGLSHGPYHSVGHGFRHPHDSSGNTLPSSPSGLSEAEYSQSPTAASSTTSLALGAQNGGQRIQKRQRTGDKLALSLEHPPDTTALASPVGAGPPISSSMRKLNRTRSDSAPLGYGLGTTWEGGRPRSGSGVAGRVGANRGYRAAQPEREPLTEYIQMPTAPHMVGMMGLGISTPLVTPNGTNGLNLQLGMQQHHQEQQQQHHQHQEQQQQMQHQEQQLQHHQEQQLQHHQEQLQHQQLQHQQQQEHLAQPNGVKDEAMRCL